MTTLSKLMAAQDKQAAAIVTKQLDAEGWQINPNDILWAYHDPQVTRQQGRAKRIYHRLLTLQGD